MPQERNSIGVRVRPNADQFIADLHKQMAAKKFTFYANVGADTKRATTEVQAWAKTRLKTIPATVNVGANMSPATGDLRAWRATQRNIKTNIPIGVDLSSANRDIRVFREAVGRNIDVKIRVSGNAVRDAKTALRDIEVEPKIKPMSPASMSRYGLEMQKQLALFDIEPTVKPKTKGAEAEVKSFTARASKDPIEKKLDLDLKEARLRLLTLKAEALANKLTVKVDVETSKFDAFQRKLKQLTIGSGSRRGGALSFNIPGPLGTISAPGGLAGIVALGAAAPAAVTAVTSLSKALIDLAGAAAIVPGAIAAVGASVATLAIGTQGVGDAFKAMFDLWKEGSDAQQSQIKAVVSAHTSYRTALDNEATAQRNVSQARENALNDLRNLHNELRRGSLNEAQAILNVQKAADTIAKGGFANQTEYTQALLDQANAQQDLIEVRERNNQLQQKGNEENAKGVEGSDQVVAALQAQTQAADATAAALQAISDTQAAGATSKFADALGRLSPNARDFLETINSSKGPLQEFGQGIQDIIFQGAGPAFKNLFKDLLPTIEPGMRDIAQGLNKNLLQVFDSLSSPGGKSIIERILGGTAESQKALTGLIDPLIRGVGTLAAAGAEKLPQLIDLFTRLATKFADFVEGADKSGKLDAFMDRGIKALEQLVDISVNLIRIINDLGNAFGGDLLQSIENVTGRLHNFLSSTEGQNKLKDWIKEAGKLWDDWKPTLEQLPELINRLSTVATQALNVISPVLSGILTALEKAPILVEAFAAVWLGSKMLSAVSTVLTLGKTVADMVGNLAKLPKALASLPGLGAGAAGTPAAPIAAAGSALGVAAAAAPFVAVVGGFLAAGSALYDAAPDEDKRVAGTKITTGDLGNARTGGRGTTANTATNDQATAERLLKQGKPPPFGSAPYDFLVKSVQEGKFAQDYPYIGVGADGHLVDKRSGQVLPGFEVGGFTNWPQSTGKMAMLHGKEYVQPADTVSHYGVGAMKAVHEKRVPKSMLQSFEGGGYFDPTSGQWVPEGAAPSQHGVTSAAVDPSVPGSGGPPRGIVPTVISGATGIAQSFANQAVGAIQAGQGLGPAPGPAIPGVGTGPLPGPAVPDLSAPMPAGAGQQMNFNLFGINIPLGNAPVNNGWGNAGAPPGLGGGPPGPNGEAPFDIRNYGIGPGPAGSGPADWLQEVGKIGGNFLSGAAGALAEGFLGGLGVSGLSGYGSDAAQIAQHFIPKGGSTDVQAPGAADSNAAALQDIQSYYNTPDNPAFPGLPPGVSVGPGKTPGDVAISTSAAINKRFQGSGVISAKDAHDQGVIERAKAPNAQVLPNANVVSFLRIVGEKFNLHPGAEGQEGGNPYRTSEATSQHTVGRAMDLYGTEADKARFVQWWESNPDFLNATRQVIYGQNPKLDVYGGTIRDVYGAKTNAAHFDHVHIALEGVPAAAAGIDWGTAIPGVSNADKPLGPHIQLGPRRGGPKTTFTQWGVPRQGGSDIKRLAQFLYLQAGMPQDEWDSFDQLLQHESGWDPTAKNPGSTAYGLGQFLDSTQKQYGILGSSDPAKQLMAIFSYLKNRQDYHGSPAAAWSLWQSRTPHWYDQGGWLMPGATTTVNATGKPELILPPAASASFLAGGFNFFKPPEGIVPGPIPPPGPTAKTLNPRTQPTPPPARTLNPPTLPKTPTAPSAPEPSPAPPVGGPAVPPGKAGDLAPPSTPTVPTTPPPPSRQPISPGVTPATVTPGIDPADRGQHLHPALEKGITSGAKALGQAASTAISVIASAAGSSGFAPGASAVGAIGPYVAGLIEQGGKIVKNIANVPSSFLVGSATSGTTQNPYGVTQRSSNPSSGTYIDQSHHGDVYTQNADDFFHQMDIREAQKAQGILGRFG